MMSKRKAASTRQGSSQRMAKQAPAIHRATLRQFQQGNHSPRLPRRHRIGALTARGAGHRAVILEIVPIRCRPTLADSRRRAVHDAGFGIMAPAA